MFRALGRWPCPRAFWRHDLTTCPSASWSLFDKHIWKKFFPLKFDKFEGRFSSSFYLLLPLPLPLSILIFKYYRYPYLYQESTIIYKKKQDRKSSYIWKWQQKTFINSTNFPETKHKLVVNDGRPIMARAAVIVSQGDLMQINFLQTLKLITDMGICYQLNST